MSMPNAEPEYTSYISLLVLGDELQPRNVSRTLGLRPTQSWSKGDPKQNTGRKASKISVHSWGGWKKAAPASQSALPFSSQLRYWVRTLRHKTPQLLKLTRQGHLCVLNCYLATSATASIVIPSVLQLEVATLGLELRLSAFALQDA